MGLIARHMGLVTLGICLVLLFVAAAVVAFIGGGLLGLVLGGVVVFGGLWTANKLPWPDDGRREDLP